ncbi:MAG: sugar phosphate isomerase/epimerase family protein [Armatimonadota bacterium]
MKRFPIAVQLYTLRDQTAADFPGTLREVARMGYDGVEFAGYGGLGAGELKSLLEELGLRCAGAHEGIERLEQALDEVIAFHRELGNRYVVVPWLGEDRWGGPDGWRKMGRQLGEFGGRLREAGLHLCYHNHSFEFQRFDGEYGLDILYASAPADALQAELDTYWVKHGGENPIAYIERYAGRIPLIHLKDMAAGEDRAFAEVGEGILDIPGIFRAAENAGTEWIIVEQDVCQRPPLESVQLSLENLRKMGLA